MNDDFTVRQAAISLRLVGSPVKQICSSLAGARRGFTCGCRYLEDVPMACTTGRGPSTRSPVAFRPFGCASLSIRSRIQAHASPATRDNSLIGTTAIRADLKGLISARSPERTIEAAQEAPGLTRVR